MAWPLTSITAVPFVGSCAMALTVSVGLSGSLSLVSTLPVAGVSATVVPVSSTASATWLTLTTMVSKVNRVTWFIGVTTSVPNSKNVSVGVSKRLLWRSAPGPDEINELERDLHVHLMGTADSAEGVRAFMEKRDPQWSLSPTEDWPTWLDER